MPLFQNIKFYLVDASMGEDRLEQIKELLVSNGARHSSYLTDTVTLVICDCGDATEAGEAKDIYDIPVVMSHWAECSLKLNMLLPYDDFTPSPEAIFKGFVFCPTRISPKDCAPTWLMARRNGAECVADFSESTTHLICWATEGPKYESLLQKGTAAKCKLVSPDWLLDCVREKKVLNEACYHPARFCDAKYRYVPPPPPPKPATPPKPPPPVPVKSRSPPPSPAQTPSPVAARTPQDVERERMDHEEAKAITSIVASLKMETQGLQQATPKANAVRTEAMQSSGGAFQLHQQQQHQPQVFFPPQQEGSFPPRSPYPSTAPKPLHHQQHASSVGAGAAGPSSPLLPLDPTRFRELVQQQQPMASCGTSNSSARQTPDPLAGHPHGSVSSLHSYGSQPSPGGSGRSLAGTPSNRVGGPATPGLQQQSPVASPGQQPQRFHHVGVQENFSQTHAGHGGAPGSGNAGANVQYQQQMRQAAPYQQQQQSQQQMLPPHQQHHSYALPPSQNPQAAGSFDQQQQRAVQQFQGGRPVSVQQAPVGVPPNYGGGQPLQQQNPNFQYQQQQQQQMFLQQQQLSQRIVMSPSGHQMAPQSAMGQQQIPPGYVMHPQQQQQQQMMRFPPQQGVTYIREGYQQQGPQPSGMLAGSQHNQGQQQQNFVAIKSEMPQAQVMVSPQYQLQPASHQMTPESMQGQQRMMVAVPPGHLQQQPQGFVHPTTAMQHQMALRQQMQPQQQQQMTMGPPGMQQSYQQQRGVVMQQQSQFLSPTHQQQIAVGGGQVLSPQAYMQQQQQSQQMAQPQRQMLVGGQSPLPPQSLAISGRGVFLPSSPMAKSPSAGYSVQFSPVSVPPGQIPVGGSPQRMLQSPVGPHMGAMTMQNVQAPVQQRIQYFGHEPHLTSMFGSGLHQDMCLVGCVFCIVDYERILDQKEVSDWRIVIVQHGGEVESLYSPRVTHVLCENLLHPVVRQALKDGRRCVTAFWLNDCMLLQPKRMIPPWKAIHFPSNYGENKPCKEKLFAVTGFEGNDRNCVIQMIAAVGGRYTRYLCQNNAVLIAKRLDGEKVAKAAQWGIAIVGVHWLAEIVLGNAAVYANAFQPVYRPLPNHPDPFRLDVNRLPPFAMHLLQAWTIPISVSQESWKQSVDRKQKLENDDGKIFPYKKMKLSPAPDDKDMANSPAETLPPDQRPYVLFTGFYPVEEENLTRKLNWLGGESTDDVLKCTHVVAADLKRTLNLLKAVSLGKPIVSALWIRQSYKSQRLNDAKEFVIRDEGNEKFFGFNIKRSLHNARHRRLFLNLMFYLTPSILPSLAIVKDIIEAAGGAVLQQIPTVERLLECEKNGINIVIVTCENDLHLCASLLQRNVAVHSAEFILTGVLRQEVDYQSYRIECKPMQNGHK